MIADKLSLFVLYMLFMFSAVLNGENSVADHSGLTGYKTAKETEIDSLLLLSDQLKIINPDKAFKVANEALSMLHADDSLVPVAYFKMGSACFMMGLNDSSLVFFDKALKHPLIKNVIKGQVYNSMCMVYRKSGKYTLAFEYADSALQTFQRIGDSVNIAYSLYKKAQVHHVHGDFEESLNLLFGLLDKFEARGDKEMQTSTLGEIADIYMDLGKYEKAKSYFLRLFEERNVQEQHYYYGNLLNNYGTLLYEEKDYDSALSCYYMAMKVFKLAEQEDGMAVASQNIGITCVFLGKIKKGIGYLKNALNTFERLDLKNDVASALIDMGTAYTVMKRYDSANVCYQKVLDITSQIKSAYYKNEALRLLYRLNELRGDYKGAFEYYQRYMHFNDSIKNFKMQKHIQELDIQYKTAKRQKEIMRLKDQQLIEKANNRFLTGMITWIVAVSLLLLFGLWIKRRKDVQLQKQKLLIAEKEKILMKEKIARQRILRDQLENELEFKNRQLALHALNMMHKNTLLKDLTSVIENKMIKAGDTEKQNLKELKRHIQKGLDAEKDWELFKLYFEQVNAQFFGGLRKVNPKLTENDFKLCALIKLNMNIKEMATVLNISPDSLKNARYRLKKKLNLGTGDDLRHFLNSI
jgi:tetratricopeptide (TPR) repeat protein